jgi:hypothetical protein
MCCDRAPIDNPRPIHRFAQNNSSAKCVTWHILHTCRTRRIIGPGSKGINRILVYKDLLPIGKSHISVMFSAWNIFIIN